MIEEGLGGGGVVWVDFKKRPSPPLQPFTKGLWGVRLGLTHEKSVRAPHFVSCVFVSIEGPKILRGASKTKARGRHFIHLPPQPPSELFVQPENT